MAFVNPQLVEAGRPKCDRYFPRSVDEPLRFGSVTVRLLDSGAAAAAEATPHWRRSTLSVSRDDDRPAIEVQHLELTSWPDHGVPSSPAALLALIAEAHRLNGGRASTRPILAHCSAGVGRTGTTIACSALQELLPLGLEFSDHPAAAADPPGMPPLTAEDMADPVVRTVDALREQRMMLVQTRDQLAFVYAALAAAAKAG